MATVHENCPTRSLPVRCPEPGPLRTPRSTREMGVVIAATAVSSGSDGRSSTQHSSEAAKICVRLAGIRADQVDLLVTPGGHRDFNVSEPSVAALIQREVGTTRDPVASTPRFGFSKERMNGARGFLNSVQVASEHLRSGDAEYVLLVSGDAHTSSGEPDREAVVGTSMLLRRACGPGEGFGCMRVASMAGTSPESLGFPRLTPVDGENGHADYQDLLVEVAYSSALGYAQFEGLDLDRTLLLTSQPAVDFGVRVAARLGLPARAAMAVNTVIGDSQSSALTIAYHQVVTSALDARYEQVLFVAVGSDLSSVCVAYRPSGGTTE